MDHRRAHALGVLLMIGAGLSWSMGGLIVRHVETTDRWEIVFWRSFFMLLSLGLYMAVTYRDRAWVRLRATGLPGVASAALLGMTIFFFIFSITRTTVANTLVIMSASPFVAAILGWLILRERIDLPTWAAMTLGFGGIALMFADSLDSGRLAGNLFALGVSLAFAANIIVLRRARMRTDMVPAVFLSGAMCVALSLPLAWPLDAGIADIAWLALMGMGQLALGCLLFTKAVPHLSAAEIGLLSLLEVILGPIWVWARFGERPSDLALIGGAIVILALAANEVWKARRQDGSRIASASGAR